MAKKDPRLKKLADEVKESLAGEDFSKYSEVMLSLLGDGFAVLSDSRQQSKVKHLLRDCIAIVLFCVFSDIDEWIEMEMFAEDNLDTLKKYLELPNGVPSHDTLERVMSVIKPEELQDMLVDVLRETITRACGGDGYLYENPKLELYIKDVVAVDGKETRNSGDPYSKDPAAGRNFNVLNVQSTETGITLSATRIDEKTNEIPEAQSVLKKLDLRGCVVTADAMNTQKETARVIVEEAHADYCLALKSNHPLFCSEMTDFFHDPDILRTMEETDGQFLEETESNSAKKTSWQYYITDDISWFAERNQWKKLKSFGYVKKTTVNKKTGETSMEERYYLLSVPPVADLFSLVVGRHWHIENLLHWVLDVVFKEDSLRTREKKALNNLGLVKRFVLSVLKILKPYYNNISFRYIRRKIGRNLEKEIPVIFAVLKKMYDMGAAFDL